MISANVKKTGQDAIRTTVKAAKAWKLHGDAIRTDYADKAAFEAIKPEWQREIAYPAMSDTTITDPNGKVTTFTALAIVDYEMPTKKHKDYIGASPSLQAFWDAIGVEKAKFRGMASSYFARVRDTYAFPEPTTEAESSEADKAAKSPRGRIAGKAGELQTMIQKQEALLDHDKALLVALAAWQTIEATSK
jgi:hypothetical protein